MIGCVTGIALERDDSSQVCFCKCEDDKAETTPLLCTRFSRTPRARVTDTRSISARRAPL